MAGKNGCKEDELMVNMELYGDWLFFEGDARDGFKAELDDGEWERVEIPHDWAVRRELKRDMEADPRWEFGPQAQGFLDRWGIGWYRKHLVLEGKKEGKRYFLRFDGVFERCRVYMNGVVLGEHQYGYSGFSLEVTDVIEEGENLVAVRVDNSVTITDRWYSGCGIYRKVELLEVPETYLGIEDVRVTADFLDGKGKLVLQVDGKGEEVSAELEGVFDPVGLRDGGLSVENLDVRPWSAEEPRLYKLKISVPGQTLEMNVGFRHVEFRSGEGMFVNGEAVKLKGVCLHHDGGCVGAAVTGALLEKRLRVLKGMGCNAIRTSHNIPSAEMMDLCDRMGFYVLDECFDKWVSGAYSRFYETDWEEDLAYLILRDRNRPSVVMWSVGNEIEDQGAEPMLDILKGLCGKVRSLDTRPVTVAMSPHYRSFQGEPVEELVADKVQAVKRIGEIVDIIGCNYQEQWYEAIHKEMPDKLILGTEVYLFFKGSYDHYFNYSTENPWMDVERNDFCVGGYLWAGVDYLGESMGFPSKGWAGALIQSNLVRKPISYLWESYWSERPMVHISVLDYTRRAEIVREPWSEMPLSDCWNYPMFVKIPMPYMIFSNCQEVRLSVNGKYFDIPRPGECESRIIDGFLPLETGLVLVEGVNDGKVVCSHKLVTSGASSKLGFVEQGEAPERLPAQLLFTVAAMDGDGNVNPRESGEVRFSVEGPCVIEGVDNGYLCNMEPYGADRVHMNQGKASVVLRVTGRGRIAVYAFAEGLLGADAQVVVEA